MVNYKYILAAGTAMLLPISVSADTCSTLPTCDSLGFTYTAEECGKLKKLKCPFGNAYFCSGSNCKSVKVGSEEICTKYCEDDKNVCIEKRAMTCSELLSKYNCTRYNHNSTISGTISKDICLFGTVTQPLNSEITLTQMNVYDAGKRWPVCESEMTGRAKLDLVEVWPEGDVHFYTNVDINYLQYPPQKWQAYFYGKTNNIHIYWSGESYFIADLSLYFEGEIGNPSNNNILISCYSLSDDRDNPTYCGVQINHRYANVRYCGNIWPNACNIANYGSVKRYAKLNVTCNDEALSEDNGRYPSTCEKDVDTGKSYLDCNDSCSMRW